MQFLARPIWNRITRSSTQRATLYSHQLLVTYATKSPEDGPNTGGWHEARGGLGRLRAQNGPATTVPLLRYCTRCPICKQPSLAVAAEGLFVAPEDWLQVTK